MDERTKETIRQCILFLKNHGYEVKERDGHKVGKWVAFRQDGMDCILHGRVIYDYVGTYCIRCKNGCKRFVGLDNIIEFYDTKRECYKKE